MTESWFWYELIILCILTHIYLFHLSICGIFSISNPDASVEVPMVNSHRGLCLNCCCSGYVLKRQQTTHAYDSTQRCAKLIFQKDWHYGHTALIVTHENDPFCILIFKLLTFFSNKSYELLNWISQWCLIIKLIALVKLLAQLTVMLKSSFLDIPPCVIRWWYTSSERINLPILSLRKNNPTCFRCKLLLALFVGEYLKHVWVCLAVLVKIYDRAFMFVRFLWL